MKSYFDATATSVSLPTFPYIKKAAWKIILKMPASERSTPTSISRDLVIQQKIRESQKKETERSLSKLSKSKTV